jgi:predicted O-linked N-acetylglucosamine transferase (SPINDLY family)
LPRTQFGLGPHQHLYLCFQNPRKLHPDLDPLLGAILRGDPDGVVVLKGDRPGLRDALLARLRRTLPDLLDRVRLLPALPERAYLSLVAHADVVLDTPHYSGANTSYEAFAAGVPVVTLPGSLQRGRFTLGLYRAMGLAHEATSSPEAYVAKALALGTDPSYRTQLSARIKAAAPCLFDQTAPGHELARFLLTLISSPEAPH